MHEYECAWIVNDSVNYAPDLRDDILKYCISVSQMETKLGIT